MVLSAEDGKKVRNLTKGWTNQYRYLVDRGVLGQARPVLVTRRRSGRRVRAPREQVAAADLRRAVRRQAVRRDRASTTSSQCASPAFSPDGRRVAFEGNRNGVVDIFEVDLETQRGTQPDAGRLLRREPVVRARTARRCCTTGASARTGRSSPSIWPTRRSKTQLTFGPSSDIQPSYSRDGSTVYFSSDRGRYDVFNLYALDLTTRRRSGSTPTWSAAASRPSRWPSATASRTSSSPRSSRARSACTACRCAQPERTIDVAERSDAEPSEAEPYEPPLRLTHRTRSKKTPYKLRWDIERTFDRRRRHGRRHVPGERAHPVLGPARRPARRGHPQRPSTSTSRTTAAIST